MYVISLPNAPLLLVVGMHRSGTSLLGGLMSALGTHFPGQQISGDVHNPDGYFEWKDVVDIHERLLIDLDRWWPSYKGCLKLPPDWMVQPATNHVRDSILNLLRDHLI